MSEKYGVENIEARTLDASHTSTEPEGEVKFGKGVLATGLSMREGDSTLRLAMKLVESRFYRLGLPVETFWSEWESRETFQKKLQRITDKVEKNAGNGSAVPVLGISMGAQLALRVAGLEREHVNGIVGIVPVVRGIGQDDGIYDRQYHSLMAGSGGPQAACGEAVTNIEDYLESGLLQTLRSMAVISKEDEVVFNGMSMLPGAVLYPSSRWSEVSRHPPKDRLVTIETPYKGNAVLRSSHALAGAFIMLFNTRMLVERIRQDAEIKRA